MTKKKRKEDYEEDYIPEPGPPSAGEFRGTSIFQGGQVKQLSEEAQLAVCPDCGFLQGRHSRSCPKGS